ncbi:hypothetical protein IR450_003636, partial [Escherichia coli]|nr:hypothetical protein [Escherichia coli]ELQ6713104.1 tryptophanase leader peptide [Escherichia coli]ELZ5487493.1 tryptophanase leader peptide [Escherichia coli]HAJ4327785.1 hypothetical protein [Escherichia coli]
MNILHICVTSK